MARTEEEQRSSEGMSPQLRAALRSEAPRIGVLEAVRTEPLAALLPLIVCLGIAVGLWAHTAPTYKATSRLRVSPLDLRLPGAIPGIDRANSSLATTFSLAVDSDDVIQPAAEELHLSPSTVRRSISGRPVADTPLFVLTAEYSERAKARAIVNTVANSLVRYSRAQRPSRARAAALVKRYQAESRVVASAEIEAVAARRAFASSGSALNARRLADARAAVQAANLRRDAVRAAFMSATDGGGLPTAQVLRAASDASSNRMSELQIYLFIGALAGIAIGLALATMRANRRLRRSLGL
jgi:capsular polysaccharide biosynthesis protein